MLSKILPLPFPDYLRRRLFFCSPVLVGASGSGDVVKTPAAANPVVGGPDEEEAGLAVLDDGWGGRDGYDGGGGGNYFAVTLAFVGNLVPPAP